MFANLKLRTHWHRSVFSVTFSHDTTMRIKAPNPAELTGDSMVLKEQLATALEVDFPSLVETLKAHKYILTFDVSHVCFLAFRGLLLRLLAH